MTENTKSFNFKNAPIDLLTVAIETARLKLVSVDLKHKDAIFENFTEKVLTYMPFYPPTDISEITSFIENARSKAEEGSNLQLVICDRQSGDFLGCCGLHGGENPNIPELGIWLRESAHSKGFGFEAMQAVKNWGDLNLNYDYITYPVDRRNKGSVRIAEKLKGKVLKSYTSVAANGKELDELLFRIDRE